MSTIGFVSTGNADEDQKLAEDLELRDRRVAEGMCTNGCGPMNRTDGDGFEAQCPKCFFVAGGNTARFAGLPFAEWRQRPSREETT